MLHSWFAFRFLLAAAVGSCPPRFAAIALIVIGLAGTTTQAKGEEAAIATRKFDFTREIRPILANHRRSCHGPDEKQRKAGLRLDLADQSRAKLESGFAAIVPGRSGESELVARIESADEAEVMPPPAAKKPLTAEQKKLLRQWIDQGAEYAQHWAFILPKRPALPRVKNMRWARNSIDLFVLKRLEDAGLAPAPEADKGTLLRRVTLDLTGLPPTLKELDDFLADKSADAYEKVVDRLLESPRYGEKMAMQWLDAARYADTNGYNNDEERTMWPWRDWVIRAFNANMPFDQFLVEQLAGDLLPDPRLEQKIATGFNRNHVLTTEGGIIDEEYRVEYVADRVHTTATVVMGLSMQCARCHDHKYDPISQREYYQFFAFFNNVADKTVNYNQGGAAEPYLKAPTAEQQQVMTQLTAQKALLEKQLAARKANADEPLAKWEAGLSPEEKQQLAQAEQTLRVPFDETEGVDVSVEEGEAAKEGAGCTILPLPLGEGRGEGGAVEDSRPRPDARPKEESDSLESRLQAAARVSRRLKPGLQQRAHPNPLPEGEGTTCGDAPSTAGKIHGTAVWKPGKSGNALAFEGDTYVDLGQRGIFDRTDSVSFSAWVFPTSNEPGAILSKIDDAQAYRGYDFLLEGGKPAVHLVHHWPDIGLKVIAKQPVALNAWHHVLVTWDGSSKAAGVKIYVDGRPQELDTANDKLADTIKTDQPLRIGKRSNSNPFRGLIDDVRFFNSRLTEEDSRRLADGGDVAGIGEILARSPDKRSPEQSEQLRRLYLETVDAEYRTAKSELAETSRRYQEVDNAAPEDDGHGRAGAAPHGAHSDPRAIRSARGSRGSRRSDGPLVVAGQCAAEPARSGPVASAAGASADGARGGQSVVGDVFRRGSGGDGGRFRRAGLAPESPRAARLAGDRVCLSPLSKGGSGGSGQKPLGNRVQEAGKSTGSGQPADESTQPLNATPPNPPLRRGGNVREASTASEAGSATPPGPPLLRGGEGGWNIKALQRLIVTSATYRQSSHASPALIERDPKNRLLARGPRFRLSAESVRDNALAISGLMRDRIGGPSVKPYQPAGLWEEVSVERRYKYVADKNDGLYRRSMYTFWKRTCPPPGMTAFDAPDRETCLIRRATTNTPLQALVLLNDPTYVECARKLAERLMREAGPPPVERLTHAFRLAVSRPPGAGEQQILLGLFQNSLARFQRDTAAADKLLAVGDSPRDPQLDVAELAAWTALASIVLNLDETITKN